MSLNAFQATSQINVIGGNAQGDVNNPNWTAIERQINLIQSELDEAKDSLAARNIDGLRDDVCDVLFTAYGLGFRCGFPTDQDYEEVCRSNMTKFDATVEDAKISQQKYRAIGVETTIRFVQIGSGGEVLEFFVLNSASNQVGHDGKSYPEGKWLKSYKFEEPKFAPILETETA